MSVSIILLNILVLPILPGEWLLAVGTGLVGIVLPVATLRALVLRGAFFWGGGTAGKKNLRYLAKISDGVLLPLLRGRWVRSFEYFHPAR